MKVVIDADVLIGALDASDQHHDASRELFAGWNERSVDRLMSVVNLSEVLVAPAADRARLRSARRAIRTLGVAVHQPSEAVGVEAARLRARHPISLADAYCLATAKHIAGLVSSFDARIARAAEAEGVRRVTP